MGAIGLITMHNIANYGSCLQTYATQKVFESIGWSTIVIDYCRPNNTLQFLTNQAFEGKRLARLEPLWNSMPALKHMASKPISSYLFRYGAPFRRFRGVYLNETNETYFSCDELKSNPPLADVYCTGSDQVWNSVWNGGFDQSYYLTWVPGEKPRVAYSSSIGRENLDEWEEKPMRRALRRYAAISVREESAVRVLAKLGIKSTLVLDPTLMLNDSDWGQIATRPKQSLDGYILVYQLNPNDNFSNYASMVSKELGLPLVKLCYRGKDRQKGAINIVSPEVTDFLGLFFNASYVITDSFHATAFSLNFQKPFVSIAPNRFSTRITSVLELTGTSNRLLRNKEDISLMLRPIDFDYARQVLEAKREESLDFLRCALDVTGTQASCASDDDRESHGC